MKFLGWLCFFLLISFIAQAQTNPDTLQTTSGLRYIILENGHGPAVKKGDKVAVQYTGRFRDGRVFDSSGKKLIRLQAGTGEVIPGWDEMLLLMHPGEEVEVQIPAKLAYGQIGVRNEEGDYRIPPNTDLFFRMKVVEVK